MDHFKEARGNLNLKDDLKKGINLDYNSKHLKKPKNAELSNSGAPDSEWPDGENYISSRSQ